jgi:hypothetical protein
MTTRPVIENAPGLTLRALTRGRWMARWQCRSDLAARGFKPKTHWMWTGEVPGDLEIAFIQDQCKRLNDEMLAWAAGGIPEMAAFDGKIGSLVACYQTDVDSPYRKLRYKSREHYDVMCRRLERDITEPLSELKARSFLRLYDQWSDNGKKLTAAHHYMGMVRILVNFGATFLEDGECERLSGVLHRMKFKQGKPREERLTVEQVNAIREAAHLHGRPSIALGQAFQFECILRQKDVIGEWVPMNEPGLAVVHTGNEKWLRGITWQEIGSDLVLRHVTSKRQKMLEVPLAKAPMVVLEFDRLFPGAVSGNGTINRSALPSHGPVVVSEYTTLPWGEDEYRRHWRKMADYAGVPKSVRNMDSRAGGITEATEAGVELEHLKHAATHGQVAMTERYSRGASDKVALVMEKRAAHRVNKPGKAE